VVPQHEAAVAVDREEGAGKQVGHRGQRRARHALGFSRIIRRELLCKDRHRVAEQAAAGIALRHQCQAGGQDASLRGAQVDGKLAFVRLGAMQGILPLGVAGGEQQGGRMAEGGAGG
jgi:hypothetical protein